jgi:hypothetical protein
VSSNESVKVNFHHLWDSQHRQSADEQSNYGVRFFIHANGPHIRKEDLWVESRMNCSGYHNDIILTNWNRNMDQMLVQTTDI